MNKVMYEIIRHTIAGDRETDFDYFDSQKEAEEVAADLTECYKEDDGHPWGGDRFYVVPVTQETIDARNRSWAMTMACQELGIQD